MRVLCCAVCALAGLHMSQSHDYSLVMPAYTSGQPSSVSDAVTVVVKCCDWTISDSCLGDCHICHNCHCESSYQHYPLPPSRYVW